MFWYKMIINKLRNLLIKFFILFCAAFKTMKNYYIKLFVFAVTICVAFTLQGQNREKIDSLESLLPFAKESQKADIFIALAEIFRNSDTLKSRNYSEQALSLSNKLGYDKGAAGANIVLGLLERDKDNYAKTKMHYLFALSLALRSKDLVTIAKAYQSMGNLYLLQNDYSKAMRYYLGAMSTGEKANSIQRVAIASKQIGHICLILADTAKAESYYNKAYKIFIQLGDEIAIANCENDLATINRLKGNNFKALSLYSKSLDVFKKYNMEREMSAVLNNIGIIYGRGLNNPKKAITFYYQAYLIDSRLGLMSELVVSTRNMSSIYLLSEQYDSTIFYGLQALKIAKENKFKEIYGEICEVLSVAYEKKGDSKNALYYMNEYKDNIVLDAAKGAEIENIHSGYIKAKQNETIKNLNKENISTKEILNNQNISVQRKNVILIALILFIVFLVLIVILIFYFAGQHKARKKLELTSAAKSNILNRISHELRTPLGSLMNYSYLANDSKNINELRNYLNGIRATGNELLFSMNNIVSYMQIDSKSDEAVESTFNLIEMLQSIFTPFDAMCKQKGLFFTQLISPDLPHFVVSDKLKVATIIQNLLSNAFNASYQGVIKIEIKLIESSTLQHEKFATIQIQVSDEGRGLKGKKLKDLDLPFVKNDNISRGFGLGLFIVKKFAEKLNAKFELIDNLNVGATATLRLNLLLDEQKALNTADKPLTKKPEEIRILLVEDDDVNNFTLGKILTNHGFSIVSANYGKLAMSNLLEKTFDMVLIDAELPDMTGIELSKHIRYNDEFSLDKDIPIILLSANAEPIEIKESLNVGINEYMTKPINKDLLISKIMEFVG